MEIGGRTRDVITNPVRDASGAAPGTIGEWRDVTDQLRAEREIATLVEAAARGDYSQRWRLQKTRVSAAGGTGAQPVAR